MIFINKLKERTEIDHGFYMVLQDFWDTAATSAHQRCDGISVVI